MDLGILAEGSTEMRSWVGRRLFTRRRRQTHGGAAPRVIADGQDDLAVKQVTQLSSRLYGVPWMHVRVMEEAERPFGGNKSSAVADPVSRTRSLLHGHEADLDSRARAPPHHPNLQNPQTTRGQSWEQITNVGEQSNCAFCTLWPHCCPGRTMCLF